MFHAIPVSLVSEMHSLVLHRVPLFPTKPITSVSCPCHPVAPEACPELILMLQAFASYTTTKPGKCRKYFPVYDCSFSISLQQCWRCWHPARTSAPGQHSSPLRDSHSHHFSFLLPVSSFLVWWMTHSDDPCTWLVPKPLYPPKLSCESYIPSSYCHYISSFCCLLHCSHISQSYRALLCTTSWQTDPHADPAAPYHPPGRCPVPVLQAGYVIYVLCPPHTQHNYPLSSHAICWSYVIRDAWRPSCLGEVNDLPLPTFHEFATQGDLINKPIWQPVVSPDKPIFLPAPVTTTALPDGQPCLVIKLQMCVL